VRRRIPPSTLHAGLPCGLAKCRLTGLLRRLAVLGVKQPDGSGWGRPRGYERGWKDFSTDTKHPKELSVKALDEVALKTV
jgi:hypothetical protein